MQAQYHKNPPFAQKLSLCNKDNQLLGNHQNIATMTNTADNSDNMRLPQLGVYNPTHRRTPARSTFPFASSPFYSRAYNKISTQLSSYKPTHRRSPARVVFPPSFFSYPRSTRRQSAYRSNKLSPASGSGFSSTSVIAGGPDRFIPSNRTHDNQCRLRPTPYHSHNDTHLKVLAGTNRKSRDKIRKDEAYRQQLRQVLWGSSQIPTRRMSFGIKQKDISQRNNIGNPFPQDVLQKSSLLPPPLPLREQQRKKTNTKIALCSPYEARDMLIDDNLRLVSYCPVRTVGPERAVAIKDEVYIWENGDPRSFTCTDDGDNISAVLWSPTITNTTNGKKQKEAYLALGSKKTVEVWSVENDRLLFQSHDHVGYVTALCWNDNGRELCAASEKGFKRYFVKDTPRDVRIKPIDYEHDNDAGRVTCLQWRGNTVVSASNGTIRVWNSNQNGGNIQPLHIMEHAGACALKFSPSNPALLVSGGHDGLRFWNVQAGTIRASIDMNEAITDIAWSVRNKILVAHGDLLSIWRLDSSKPTELAEERTRGYKIMAMTQGPCGEIACVLENGLLTTWEISKRSSTRSCSPFGVSILR